MAKINRYSGNLRPFAADALDFERTVFGSETEADDLDSNITSDFFRGWGIVGVNENPTKQDFNGMTYTVSQLIAYLHQMGITEWDDEQEFAENGFCVGSDGRLYQSLVAENVGNDPITDGGMNWLDVFTAANIDYDNTDSGLTAENVKAALDELKNAVNIDYDNTDSGLSATNVKTALDEVGSAALLASAPAYYERSRPWKAKDRTTNKTIIVSPDYLMVNIDRNGYVLTSAVEIDVTAAASWDDVTATDWTVAANRAGKDFYIYAVKPSSGVAPEFILSASSSFPDGYTADNSRKIGGFHCVCADIGTDVYAYDNSRDVVEILNNYFIAHDVITGDADKHWLRGYIQGDPIPFSIWDLSHRPETDLQEGFTYDPGIQRWVGIYLPSWTGVKVESVFNATIANGSETGTVGDETYFFAYRWQQQFGRIGQMPMSEVEFQSMSVGSPQGVNIASSADPGTTGGHSATDGLRIVSLCGAEDMAGVYWQWGRDRGSNQTTAYSTAFLSSDINVAGEHYSDTTVARFGGDWPAGSACGSRGSSWGAGPLVLNSNSSSRAVSRSRG
jgi:hypothetical protein